MQGARLCFFTLVLLTGFGLLAQNESEYKKDFFIRDGDTLLYRILYPKNFTESKKYPLILFLHGAGEPGNDNKKQLVHGGKLFVKDSVRENYPAIVVFPQCPVDDYWANATIDRSSYPIKPTFDYSKKPNKSMGLLLQLLDDLLEEPYVKRDQIYVMGLSMGGLGTFEIIYRRPKTFAAAIPICGAGSPKSVGVYAKEVPLWIFHGSKDDVVSPNQSVEMVDALLKAGAHPKFTLYDFANHNSWNPAFAEPELLSWLFSKKRSIQNEEK